LAQRPVGGKQASDVGESLETIGLTAQVLAGTLKGLFQFVLSSNFMDDGADAGDFSSIVFDWKKVLYPVARLRSGGKRPRHFEAGRCPGGKDLTELRLN